jgi:hypothetical protein
MTDFIPTGQTAYEAYCEFSHDKSLATGQSLPKWPYLTTEIQAAWSASEKAILKALGLI